VRPVIPLRGLSYSVRIFLVRVGQHLRWSIHRWSYL